MRSLHHLLAWAARAMSPVVPAAGQSWQMLGAARSVKQIESGVELSCAGGRVRVVAIDDSVVRVRVATRPGVSAAP